MSLWALVPIVMLSALACPVTMWAISKASKGKLDCMACFAGVRNKHRSTKVAEERMAVLERDIARPRTEIGAIRRASPAGNAVADAYSDR